MEKNLIRKIENMRGTFPLWTPEKGDLAKTGNYWDCKQEKGTWNQFTQEWFPMDKDYNRLVDYSFKRAGDNVSLNLWMTHPRKGASRVISINEVYKSDLPQIYAFLRDMGKELISRFQNIPESPGRANPLKLREGYKGWNPCEDSMAEKSLFLESLGAKGRFFRQPTEIIDFYFNKNVPSKNCEACHHTGYSPRALEIEKQIYSLGTGLDSFQALSEEERRVLEQAGRPLGGPLEIDSLSAHILTKHRTRKERVKHLCSKCHGHGFIPIGDERLGLNLWVILPAEGKSRGVYFKEVPKTSLPRAYEMLREARDVLIARFKRIPQSDIKIPYEKGFPDFAGMLMGHG